MWIFYFWLRLPTQKALSHLDFVVGKIAALGITNMFQFKRSLKKSTLRQYKSEWQCFLLNFATPREPLGIWQPEPHQRFGCPEMCALTWTMRLAPTAKEASIQDTVQNLSSGTNYVLQSYSAMRTGHRWCKWPQTVFKKTLPFFVQAIRIVLENLQTLSIKMMQKLLRRWEMLEWICL